MFSRLSVKTNKKLANLQVLVNEYDMVALSSQGLFNRVSSYNGYFIFLLIYLLMVITPVSLTFSSQDFMHSF